MIPTNTHRDNPLLIHVTYCPTFRNSKLDRKVRSPEMTPWLWCISFCPKILSVWLIVLTDPLIREGRTCILPWSKCSVIFSPGVWACSHTLRTINKLSAFRRDVPWEQKVGGIGEKWVDFLKVYWATVRVDLDTENMLRRVSSALRLDSAILTWGL